MRTVGEILLQKRKELNLSLGAVEKETKIRQKYLEAIEKNSFTAIAGSATVKGFIRNYAIFLNLPEENVLAVFRRDFCENERGQIIPRGIVKPLDVRKFSWTPKLTVISLVSLLILVFSLFIIKGYLGFSSAPPLQVDSPIDGLVVNEKVQIIGKTDKDATIKIDGNPITVSLDGSFNEEIVLPKGDNVISIEALNRQGKKRTIKRSIKVE